MLSINQVSLIRNLIAKEIALVKNDPATTVENFAPYRTKLGLIELELDLIEEANTKAWDSLKKAHGR